VRAYLGIDLHELTELSLAACAAVSSKKTLDRRSLFGHLSMTRKDLAVHVSLPSSIVKEQHH
jgi:hypothetical protein